MKNNIYLIKPCLNRLNFYLTSSMNFNANSYIQWHKIEYSSKITMWSSIIHSYDRPHMTPFFFLTMSIIDLFFYIFSRKLADHNLLPIGLQRKTLITWRISVLTNKLMADVIIKNILGKIWDLVICN